jgi:hypothetical protein
MMEFHDLLGEIAKLETARRERAAQKHIVTLTHTTNGETLTYRGTIHDGLFTPLEDQA